MILVGAAATATAEPKQEESSGRVSYTESEDTTRQSSDWVELASPTPTKHGTTFVMVGEDAGSFSKLRVDASKGKTIVRHVKIYFEDGTVKTVKLGRSLTPKGKKKSALIDLGDPKAIDRIAITTAKKPRGEYTVYGVASGGVVAER